MNEQENSSQRIYTNFSALDGDDDRSLRQDDSASDQDSIRQEESLADNKTEDTAGSGNECGGDNGNDTPSEPPRGPEPKWRVSRKKFLSFFVKVSLAGLAFLVLLFVYFDSVVLSKFEVDDRWVLPAVVYSRPLELYPDQKLSLKQMLYELSLLKYRNVSNPSKPGEYAVNEKSGRIVLVRRPFDFPDASESQICLMIEFSGQRVSRIVNADSSEELGYVRMDPVLLDRINRIDPKEDRIFLQLDEVPKSLINTLIEIEDRSFFSNMGVNFFAMGRAFIKNFMAGHVVEGGSTITQQLVKNYFLNSEKSYLRKFKEIVMAMIMNHRYSKEQILEAYMNEIYLGQNGNSGIYGFGLASYFYFGVPVSELSQDQMALLVGIIRGPSYYDPWRHPENALERRNTVLAVMHKRGYLTDAEYAQYSARPIGIIKRGSMNYSKTPAFMGVLKHEISSKFGDDFLSGNGIRIFSSLDPQAQQCAENAVLTELDDIEKQTGKKGLEAAMVVSSWRTAEVSAVVGSRTPQYEGFNRVLEGRRQVGSIIKPLVYLTAFHNGIHLGTVINDAPLTVKLSSGKLWQPKNDDKKFHGPIAAHTAMARSMNVPTVKIGMRVGLNHVVETMHNVGIKQEIPLYPSILLGTIELTPYEVNSIYASMATEGVYQDLTTLRTVVKDGKIVYERNEGKGSPTLDPRDTYLTLQVMIEASKAGTGRRIGNMFPNDNIATKTGTTNDNRDTWSIGIDSDEVVSTWVGFDNNKSTGLFGSSGAMRVYGAYLKARGVNSLELKRPEGIRYVYFNKQGNIVADKCRSAGDSLLPARIDKIKYVESGCNGAAEVQVYVPAENRSQQNSDKPSVAERSDADSLEREILGAD